MQSATLKPRPSPAIFVGREQELAVLSSWWNQGDERLAFVCGAGGIGKTALLNRFAWVLGAPTAFRTLPVAYGTLNRWRSARKRPLPSDVPSLLVIDEVDNGGFDMLNESVTEIRAASPHTLILASGRVTPPDGAWRLLQLGPLPTNDVARLLSDRVGDLSSEVIHRIAPLIGGSPFLAHVVSARILLSGPWVVDEILRGLNWDATLLLPGVASSAAASQLDVRIQSISDALVRRLAAEPDLMFDLRPRQLEELMAELYARQGFEVQLTPETRDGGVDLYLVQHTAFGRLLTVVDCKRNRADRPVKVEVVRQMLGTIEETGASAGVLATTSRFTSGAVKLGEKYPFRLGLQDYFDLHSMLRNATGAREPL